MGTRADFYVGRGESAEWLGSIAWDGYPDGIPKPLLKAKTEKAFRAKVASFIADREDGTKPEDGWPWPWDDSRTTDYAYALDGGKVLASCFGYEWFNPLKPQPEDETEERTKVAIFPDMKGRKSVTLGRRSGLIVVTAQRELE